MVKIEQNYRTLTDICTKLYANFNPKTMKYWVGVQWGQSYLKGRRCRLALVGNPSSDGVMIKMPY